MKKRFYLVITLLNIACILQSYGQEHDVNKDDSHEESTHHEVHKKHLISASINHTIIFSGVKDGEEASSMSLPSFGLNYTYAINSKWAVGLHSDIIIEDFVVKGSETDHAKSSSSDEELTIIERDTPIAACVMAIYKPVPYLGLMAGLGQEFSSHENFTVIRFGIEAPYHLPKNWEIFGLITYDINIDAYQSLTYGIGLGKLF